MSLTPDYKQSWAFLDAMHPARRRVITAIPLEPGSDGKKRAPTESFGPEEFDRFSKWVFAAGHDCNLYFSVAEPMGHATKKLERADVSRVHYLHVDVDPRKDKPLAQERERILAALRTPPAGIPAPTAIVYSGGGYQAYWALTKPIDIDGIEARAEDTKQYNRGIEVAYREFGADNCHDVCRIMRLPGSINLPNEKKIKRGQVPVMAAVVELHPERRYEITAFKKAVLTQSQTVGASPKMRAPENVRRIVDLEKELPALDPITRAVISKGTDLDDEGRFPSRSEPLHYICCEMVRKNIPDEIIYAVITDPDFAISASVLEKGERYALRQIERAHEKVDHDPALSEFNEIYAVIENIGGKCRIIEELPDVMLHGRPRLTKIGFDDFRNRHMNRMIQAGTKTSKSGKEIPIEIAAGQWWLSHPKRRQYRSIVFAPGAETPDDYNLWRGFAVEPKEGDWSLLRDHIFKIVCQSKKEYYDYLIGWTARMVQNPGEQGQSCIVLRGKQGCGKSMLGEIIGSLFGRHYMPLTNSKHLVGNFNAHLRDLVFLQAEEAFYAGDKTHQSTLKTLITDKVLVIEGKGYDVDTAANCIHLLMTSNEKWVIPADYDDRRFFVLDVAPDRIKDYDYFAALMHQMNTGGRSAFLHFLLNYDLSNFNVSVIPSTEGLAEQKMLSMDPDHEWWLTVLRRGCVISDEGEWKCDVPVDALIADYMRYMRTFNTTRRNNTTKLGLTIQALTPSLERYQSNAAVTISDVVGAPRTIQCPWYFRLPALDACRKHFDTNFGGPFDWKQPIGQMRLPDYPSEDRGNFGAV